MTTLWWPGLVLVKLCGDWGSANSLFPVHWAPLEPEWQKLKRWLRSDLSLFCDAYFHGITLPSVMYVFLLEHYLYDPEIFYPIKNPPKNRAYEKIGLGQTTEDPWAFVTRTSQSHQYSSSRSPAELSRVQAGPRGPPCSPFLGEESPCRHSLLKRLEPSK